VWIAYAREVMSVLYLFFVVLLLIPGAARAQVPLAIRSGEAPLSLRAALEEAMVSNPSLVALRRQFDAVRLRPASERFLMAPTLEAQIWQWPVDTINPLDVNMYMFTASQELPGRGKRALRVALGEKEVELASNEIAIRARDVIDEIKRAYADLYVTRKAIEIHQASVDLLRQFADVSTAKYAAGRISQQDVLKAVVEVSKLHEDLVRLEEQAQIGAAQLNTLLNRPVDQPVGPLSEPRADVAMPSVDALRQIAVERHPERRAAQLGVERAQASLAVAESEHKPDFVVGGGYMLMPRHAGAWTASAGITWPNAPWSRGRLDARKAEAAAEVEAARAQQQAVDAQIRLAVQNAYVRAIKAQERAELLRTSVLPQSEQTLEVSRVAYQADRVDFLALIDNQRMLLEARLGYFRALSDREQALADLERATGQDLLEGN
jgi:outer membrane protein TolC